MLTICCWFCLQHGDMPKGRMRLLRGQEERHHRSSWPAGHLLHWWPSTRDLQVSHMPRPTVTDVHPHQLTRCAWDSSSSSIFLCVCRTCGTRCAAVRHHRPAVKVSSCALLTWVNVLLGSTCRNCADIFKLLTNLVY